MKSLFIQKKIKYDGTQLKPQFAYLNHKVLGNSIISWTGACDVSFEHMVDGEDFLEQSKICSDNMLHFIIEVFDCKLITAVCLQRLFASLVMQELNQILVQDNQKAKKTSKTQGQKTSKNIHFHKQKNKQMLFVRSGDDIYFEDKKLSISIASQSTLSSMIHFAVNITNKGTPVKTCSLNDFNISPVEFSQKLMKLFVKEYNSIIEATQKVKAL